MKTKVLHAQIGWRAPMLLVQFSPFQWGFGGCFGGNRYGFSLGPLSFVIHPFPTPFECDVQKDS